MELTQADFETAREREASAHYSQSDRDDYYQLMRRYRGQMFIREAAERAIKRIREHTS